MRLLCKTAIYLPLGYQGCGKRQGGENLGKRMVIEWTGWIHAVSGRPFLGFGTLDLSKPKALLLAASFRC